MYNIEIEGGRPLVGSIPVQGAKNAVLPILAATILGQGESIIHGCPALDDVNCSCEILEYLGCKVSREGNTVIVDASVVRCNKIPESLMRKMRSSITFLGAITARCGGAEMSAPGGCELGPRPIDLHISALDKIGIRTEECGGAVKTTAENVCGGRVHLSFPSVGATENIMLASSVSDVTTVITNAAKEPEILDLQNFLNKMGAKISGAGTDEICIEGVERLSGAEHTVIPDRIAAATYLAAGAMTGGTIELLHVNPTHLRAVTSSLIDTGASLYTKKNSILLMAPKRILPIKLLRTMPYPGFPTDAQAIMTALLTLADGTSMIEENIFENRFKHVGELCKMGADITTRGSVAVIRGVKRLFGAPVTAMELRGGAALVLAGLAAEGTTVISGVSHIRRGYDTIVEDMCALGAHITKK